MNHALAAPGQARSQDTLRWGSVVNVPIVDASPSQPALNSALSDAMAQQGRQLVNAHWRWPLAWHVALMVTPYGEIGGDVNVQFNVILGSGDGQQELLRTVTVSNGGTDTAIDNTLVLPASDILIVPKIILTEGEGGHPLTGPGSVQIGAFVAPTTEPHAQLHLLEALAKMGADGAGARENGWMPPGFYPEPLGYMR